jgi:mono/diheme cytochrome c family protein
MHRVPAAVIAFAFALTALAVGLGAHPSTSLGMTLSLSPLDIARGDPELVEGSKGQGNPKAAAVKNPVPANKASIAKGQQNYNQACQHCHGPKGLGDGSLAPQNPSPSNLTDEKWDHGSSDGEIYFVIANGIRNSEMKGVRSEMSATDMWHIVNYLRSIGPKPPSR